MTTAEEAREFQPEAVDEERCKALVWNAGAGKLQCSYKPLKGKDLCWKHEKKLAHGRVRGPIPMKKYEEFKVKALEKEKASKQWYSRHLMWNYASELKPDLNFLNEQDERGQYKLTDAEYERCLWKMQQYMEKHKKKLIGPRFWCEWGGGLPLETSTR